MAKWHVVLADDKFKLNATTETLCGRTGTLNFVDKYPAHHALMTPAKTNLPVATSTRFEDKRFCNSCRHVWKRITSG